MKFVYMTALLFSTACVTQKTVTLDVEESPAAVDRIAIREARAAQNKAMAANDVEGTVRFLTDDVSLRRGLGQVVNGKAAYRQVLQPADPKDSVLLYVREPTEVEISAKWPMAFETGVWRGHLGSASGPVVINGRYSAQWVKREGRWLIRAEVFVALACNGAGCNYTSVN